MYFFGGWINLWGLMTVYLPWKTLKCFASSQTVWAHSADPQDGIHGSKGKLTRNVKKRHEPSKAKPQAKVCGKVSTAMAALCQGLLPPLLEHLKKKIKPFCQSECWHLCCKADNAATVGKIKEITKLFYRRAWEDVYETTLTLRFKVSENRLLPDIGRLELQSNLLFGLS